VVIDSNRACFSTEICFTRTSDDQITATFGRCRAVLSDERPQRRQRGLTGHRWQAQLESGDYASLSRAKSRGLVLDIIEAILRGDEALRSFSEAGRTRRLATTEPKGEDGLSLEKLRKPALSEAEGNLPAGRQACRCGGMSRSYPLGQVTIPPWGVVNGVKGTSRAHW
jgi:hypothetical protein